MTRRWATCRRNHDQTIVTEQAERAVVITLRQPACSQQQPKAVPFSSCIAALARIVASRLMVEQMQTCRGALADHLPRLSTAIEFAHAWRSFNPRHPSHPPHPLPVRLRLRTLALDSPIPLIALPGLPGRHANTRYGFGSAPPVPGRKQQMCEAARPEKRPWKS